jgi:hypothetical protein
MLLFFYSCKTFKSFNAEGAEQPLTGCTAGLRRGSNLEENI